MDNASSRTLLLAGSSIMEQWHEPAAIAPDWRVVNRAVGGTTAREWAELFPGVLAREQPRAVLLYVGSNDIAQGRPPPEIAADVLSCRTHVRAYHPNAAFAYVAIIKAPQRHHRFDAIRAVNAAVRAGLPPNDLWLETDPVFLAEGAPVAEHFLEDGVHLRPSAYLALTAAVQPVLAQWLPR